MHRFLLGLALMAGCAGGGASVGYSTGVSTYGSPDLVYVSPGVQVIADYNEPIFYTNGMYWRYYDGTWYRSRTYTGGWAYAPPPRALLRIDRPYAYRHYRPHGYVSRRTYSDNRRPVYRDNRYRDDRYRYTQPRRDDRYDRRDPRERRRDVRRDVRRDDRDRDRDRPVIRDHRR